MDTFEMNKMAGAVLLCLLVVMGVRSLGEIIYAVETPEEPVYVVEGLKTDTAAKAEAKKAEPTPFPVLLAKAEPSDGEQVFRRCQACHTVEEGGENKIGPNLYNVVGAAYGHTDGFNYSDALLDAGGEWTYQNLNQWLEAPNAFISGNQMAFAGLDDAQDRADVIAYLRQYTENPPPLPDVPETAKAEAASGDGAGENAGGEPSEESQSAE